MAAGAAWRSDRCKAVACHCPTTPPFSPAPGAVLGDPALVTSCNTGACDPNSIFTLAPGTADHERFCVTDPSAAGFCVAPPLLCPGGELYKPVGGSAIKAQDMSNIAHGLCVPSTATDPLTKALVAPTYMCVGKVDIGDPRTQAACPQDLPGESPDWLRRWCLRKTGNAVCDPSTVDE